MSHHDYVMQMVAAIIERGDDQLSSQPTYTDERWCIDLLLGLLGYEMHVTEDGDVQIWPKDRSDMEPGDGPFVAGHYRFGQVNGKWYHTEQSYRAAQGVPTGTIEGALHQAELWNAEQGIDPVNPAVLDAYAEVTGYDPSGLDEFHADTTHNPGGRA